jgi:tetratricopeptide (TPR) repeat protein
LSGREGYSEKAKREALYYLGLFHRNNSQADSALYYFELCEQVSHRTDTKGPTGFLINTVLYIGMMNDALGNRQKAVEYYNRVLDLKEYSQSRQYARNYLKKPFQF